MTEQTFTVTGMACGACETFVSEAVHRLEAVTEVSVDPARDAVTVVSREALDVAAVRTAIEQAGYEVTGIAPPTR